MESFKQKALKILRILGYPHPAIIALLTPISIAMTVYSLVFLENTSIAACISYALAAYTLTVVCLRSPSIVRGIKSIRNNNKYVNRYFSDPRLRTNISLYATLIFNTGYGIFQLGLGFKHNALLYYAFAAYYVILAAMRFFILRYTRAHESGEDKILELKRYRICGIILAFIDIALMVAVFHAGLLGRVYNHHMITAIAMAAYTFTALTLAIVNTVRFRKYDSPALSAAKIISLATASVSMLTLEAAMLTVFGEEGQEPMVSIMVTATGAVVTLLILAISVYMIVSSTKKLTRIEKQNGN